MKKPKEHEVAVAQLESKAKQKLFQSIARDWESLAQCAKVAADAEVKGVNLCRKIGVTLQQIADKEQIDFEFIHSVKSKLPKGLGYTLAFNCVRMARMFPEQVKNLEEARRATQLMFQTTGLLDAPKRTEEQNSHVAPNPWSEFVSEVAGFTSLFEKIEIGKMKDWGRTKLESFVRETKPIADKHNEALKYL